MIIHRNKRRRRAQYHEAEGEGENVIVISSPQGGGSSDKKLPEIVVENTHIYFYEEITVESVRELIVTLKRMRTSILDFTRDMELSEPPPIHLHINSEGGDALAGLSASFAILSFRDVPIYTYVEGSVASAATFISIMGARRFIQPNSFMLIHQVSSGVWGTYADIVDEKVSLDKVMARVWTIYEEQTKITKEKLDELLKSNLLLNAEECLSLGFVDEILEAPKREV